MKAILSSRVFLVLISCLSAVHAQPRQGIFNDVAALRAAQDAWPEEVDRARVAVERLFADYGPFHRAINAQPALYATLLFTVFDDYFAEDAFTDDNPEGHLDPLCVLLMFHKLLPYQLLGQTDQGARRLTATVRFTQLSNWWDAYDHDLMEWPGVALPARPRPDELVAVPEAIRPLLSMLPAARAAVAADGRLPHAVPFTEPFTRFLIVYVDHYPALSTRQRHVSFRDRQISWLREAHLKALFWVLIGRPLHQLVAQHPQLFGGLNADWLLPGAELPEDVFPNFVERVFVPRGLRRARRRGVRGADAEEEDSDAEDSGGEEAPGLVGGRGRGRGGAVGGRGGRGRGRGRGGGRIAVAPAAPLPLPDQFAAPIEPQAQAGQQLLQMPGLAAHAQPLRQQFREGQRVLVIVNPDGRTARIVVAQAEAPQAQANLPLPNEGAAGQVILPLPPPLQAEQAPPAQAQAQAPAFQPTIPPPSAPAASVARTSCPAGHSGTVSTSGAGSTSQATCSATSSHSSAPVATAGAAEKRKQEGGNSPDDGGPPPAKKQHKPDEPPKGSGGGASGMAN